MRRFLLTAATICLSAVSAFAGDVSVPTVTAAPGTPEYAVWYALMKLLGLI